MSKWFLSKLKATKYDLENQNTIYLAKVITIIVFQTIIALDKKMYFLQNEFLAIENNRKLLKSLNSIKFW